MRFFIAKPIKPGFYNANVPGIECVNKKLGIELRNTSLHNFISTIDQLLLKKVWSCLPSNL
jgi:hypothetical protein